MFGLFLNTPRVYIYIYIYIYKGRQIIGISQGGKARRMKRVGRVRLTDFFVQK